MYSRQKTEEEPFLHSLFYEYRDRPKRDVFWGWAYLILLGASIAGGVASLVSKDKSFSVLTDPTYLDDPKHCPLPSLLGAESSFAASPEDAIPAYFLQSAGLMVAICLLASFTLSILFILLLKHFPGLLVGLTCGLQVAAPIAVGLMAMYAGNNNVAWVCLAAAAMLALSFYLSLDPLRVVARLLGLSARALQSSPGLLLFSVLLKLTSMLISTLVLASMLLSAASGSVRANPVRVPAPGGRCVTITGEPVRCCVWEAAPWVAAHMPIASVTLSWTLLLVFEIKVYVVSGAVGQWYFSPVGSSPKGATRRALGHALGPSFGSLCFGSFILFLVAYIRAVMQRFKRQREQAGLVAALMDCLVACVLTAIEQLTKFTTVYMSMTGKSFLSSGSQVVDLLTRNAMDAYNVWWIPPMVLRLTSFILSLCLGYASYFVAYLLWSTSGDADPATTYTSAVALGLLVWVTSGLMLAWFSSLLLNVIDAVFVAYAVDRDNRSCMQPEVHQIYQHLPGAGGSPGSIVQQPDGGYAYAPPHMQGPGMPPTTPPGATRMHNPYQPAPYPPRPYSPPSGQAMPPSYYSSPGDSSSSYYVLPGQQPVAVLPGSGFYPAQTPQYPAVGSATGFLQGPSAPPPPPAAGPYPRV